MHKRQNACLICAAQSESSLSCFKRWDSVCDVRIKIPVCCLQKKLLKIWLSSTYGSSPLSLLSDVGLLSYFSSYCCEFCSCWRGHVTLATLWTSQGRVEIVSLIVFITQSGAESIQTDMIQMMKLKLCRCVKVCVQIPALLAAVVDEPFLWVAARDVGMAFGTGGRFSAVPFSGLWK